MNSQFVKLQSFTEDAIKSANVTNAWNDLLNNSQNDDIKRFAEELVVYSFMTSASSGGKYDIFKFVPPQWSTGDCLQLKHVMNGETDSFAAYMNNILSGLQKSETTPHYSNDELSEMILNFAFDDNIVPEQKANRVANTEAFYGKKGGIDVGNPLIFGAVSGVSTDNVRLMHSENEYPAFIKIKTDK